METKKLLNAILDSSMHPIIHYNACRNGAGEIVDFEYGFVNEIARELLISRWVPLPIEGKRLLTYFPEVKNSALTKAFRRVIKTGKAEEIEYLHHAAVGSEHWYLISIVKHDDGITCTLQDVSKLKSTLFELDHKNRKYHRLFEQSMEPVFVMDEHYMVVDSNNVFDRMFGDLSDEQIDRLFCNEEDWQFVSAKLKKKRLLKEFEADLKSRRGKKVEALINISPVFDEGSETYEYLGVVRDLSARKQADREIMMAEKLSMTGKIARTIAHEVRNPLTNLSLALEQLKDEVGEGVEDADLYFDIIDRNAKRIGALISDLLNSSKPKALILKSGNMNEVLEHVANLVADRMRLQDIKLNMQLKSPLPEYEMDAEQLHTAFLNIIVNAMEAVAEKRGVIFIKTRKFKKHLEVIVEDNGKGIPAEELQEMFEPYFTRKREGTGLGLTTVQNIIRSHDGKIRVESKVGIGTKFIVSFPLR